MESLVDSLTGQSYAQGSKAAAYKDLRPVNKTRAVEIELLYN